MFCNMGMTVSAAWQKQFNILIADDHAMFRDTLHLYMMRAMPLAKFYMASDLHEVVDVLNRNYFIPDLCIIDFLMPGMKGIDSISALVRSYPNQRFAVMSGIASPVEIERIIKSDAVGFLPKTLPGKRFIKGVETILSGEKFVAMEPGDIVMPSYFSDAGQNQLDVKLTARESQILEFICRGESNADIAKALGLQIVTVKLHVRGIFQKLDCGNRTQAAFMAREKGLV